MLGPTAEHDGQSGSESGTRPGHWGEGECDSNVTDGTGPAYSAVSGVGRPIPCSLREPVSSIADLRRRCEPI